MSASAAAKSKFKSPCLTESGNVNAPRTDTVLGRLARIERKLDDLIQDLFEDDGMIYWIRLDLF